jgi:hypothetical protein
MVAPLRCFRIGAISLYHSKSLNWRLVPFDPARLHPWNGSIPVVPASQLRIHRFRHLKKLLQHGDDPIEPAPDLQDFLH